MNQSATQSLAQAAGGLLSTMGFSSIGGKFKGSFFGGGGGGSSSGDGSKSFSPTETKSKTNNNGNFESQIGNNTGASAGASAAGNTLNISQSESKQKPQTMKISKVLAQNIIFNSLSQFITYFVNLKLPFELSRELLMHFCKKYELDQGRTHLLLSELESVQKNARYAVTWKDIRKISGEKKSKRLVCFGNEASYLSLGLIVAYLSEED